MMQEWLLFFSNEHRAFKITMQLNDLEQEDEEFRNFLKEVCAFVLSFFFFSEFGWSSRWHYRKNPRKINRRPMQMNAWQLNRNQVGCKLLSNKLRIFFSLCPGFCLKTKRLGEETTKEKIFINVCTSSQINAPREITEEELIEVVKSEDPGRYRVPISLGEPVADLDKRLFSSRCFCRSRNNVSLQMVKPVSSSPSSFIRISFVVHKPVQHSWIFFSHWSTKV